jgi:hypothetical protein
MRQRLTALKEDRVLSRREREQIIVVSVCFLFRYSAGLVDWTKTELNSISKMWAQVYKHAWGFSKGMDGSPTILDQSVGAYINWVGILVHMMKSKIVGAHAHSPCRTRMNVINVIKCDCCDI